ncbi:MAG: biotin--[acetyl-CoA-carboxylase] ligase [Treponema sp.]|nr:biotin--[acetyl-CoA-carboxylase] ligase [Treponema sp.]
MIRVYDVIDSTNSEAMRLLDAASNFYSLHKEVIYAKSQTAGRGRMNRNFFSPEGGVYFSLIYSFKDGAPLSFNPAVYTATAAVCVCRALEKLYKVETSIKWVNDIYCHGKKVSGILAEGKIDSRLQKIGAVVVGIGINVFTPKENFPKEIQNRAGSILISAKGFEPVKLVQEITDSVFNVYDNLENFPLVMEEYRKKSFLTGKTVTVTPLIENEEGQYKALVTGVTENAHLIVRLENGEEKELSSGEVTLHE